MNWSRTISKTGALATVGFVIPYAMLLPVEYAHSEFRTQPPDWNTLLLPYLPPATGCSLLVAASGITSSTPRKIVTFVQSLFLHGVTFIVCFMAFVPIQQSKIGEAERVADAQGRLTQHYLVISYPQRKGLGVQVIPAHRLVNIQFGDGGIKSVSEHEPAPAGLH